MEFGLSLSVVRMGRIQTIRSLYGTDTDFSRIRVSVRIRILNGYKLLQEDEVTNIVNSTLIPFVQKSKHILLRNSRALSPKQRILFFHTGSFVMYSRYIIIVVLKEGTE